jgi:hypothetical protein
MGVAFVKLDATMSNNNGNLAPKPIDNDNAHVTMNR